MTSPTPAHPAPGATVRLRLRPMTAGDVAEVAALERQCQDFPWSEERFLRELDNPLAAVDLCRIAGETAGFLCSWLCGEELEIHNLGTGGRWRRQGVAAALLDHVLGRGRRAGARRAFLEVREGNQPAIRLYLGRGFRITGRRPGYYADGEDALLMAADLRQPRPEHPNSRETGRKRR